MSIQTAEKNKIVLHLTRVGLWTQLLGLPLAFSIVLAALAAATAPASTMMTIRQTGAKGPFVDTLLQVVALDDIVGLVAYSVAISIALSAASGEAFALGAVIEPLVKNLAAAAIGALFGFIKESNPLVQARMVDAAQKKA